MEQDVDVIVNAWNRNVIPWWLLIPQGVSKAIKQRAGYEPFKELARHGPIPLGGAVETTLHIAAGDHRSDSASSAANAKTDQASTAASVTRTTLTALMP